MKSTKDKVSYCIGYETGRTLGMQFADISTEILLNGFKDALDGKDPVLPKEEVQSILNTIRKQVEIQQRQYVAQIAEKNKDEGVAFLEDNKHKPGVITLPSGLQYKILKSGSGAVPTIFDSVSVHYKGSLVDGTVFDSSYDRGTPQELPVNRVIQGWSEALQKMCTGDHWQLFIPSYLAYGEHGFGPQIGPNATLIFELELIEIKK